MGAGRSEAPVAYAQNEEKQADDIQKPSFFIRCSTICCCFLMVRRLSNMVPHIFEAGSKPALATPPGTSSRPIFPHISSYFHPVCLQSTLKCRQFMAFELFLTVITQPPRPWPVRLEIKRFGTRTEPGQPPKSKSCKLLATPKHSERVRNLHRILNLREKLARLLFERV